MSKKFLRLLLFPLIKKICIFLVGVGFSASVSLGASQSGWYREQNEEGADIIMVDLLYPFWPPCTYFSCWNLRMYPKGGYFYAGVSSSHGGKGDLESYHPGTVWSFWPNTAYGKRPVRNVYVHPCVYARQYVGEGASGSAGGRNISWLKPKQWYTMFIRTWGADEEKKECYVGSWMKDQSGNEWHNLGYFLVPCAAKGFTKNGGFMEHFGGNVPEPKELWRGKGFYRINGQWKKHNKLMIKVAKDNGMELQSWNVHLRDNDSVLVLSYVGGNDYPRNLERGRTHSFQQKQAEEAPTPDPILCEASSRIVGNHLIVDWSLAKESSPQLGYEIKVYDNPQFSGTPIASARELFPQVRTKSLELPSQGKSYVKLTIIDIFDQTKTESLVPQTAEKELIPSSPGIRQTAEGMEYAYVEEDADCDSLKSVSFSRPMLSGIARGFDMTFRDSRENKFAFAYKGYLRVPETGAYTFVLKSCDGSMLNLNGATVLNNDGRHSSSERRVSVFLEKGFVPLSLSYFKNTDKVESILWLGWEHGNKPLEEIPSLCLVHEKRSDIPDVGLDIANGTGQEKILKPKLPSGKIKRVDFFNGAGRVSSASQPPFQVSVMPFEGDNSFWARIYYKGGSSTVDTPRIAVKSTSVLDPAWEGKIRGETGLAHAVSGTNGLFQFAGEGECLVNKKVKGDFVLSGKILSYSDKSLGVGISCWVGLMAEKNDNLSQHDNEIAIFKKPDGKLYCSANHSDLGTKRTSLFNLDGTHSWLRITRRGNEFSCFSSADGKNWEMGMQRIIPLDQTISAGVTFLSTPRPGKAVFSATVGNVTLLPLQVKSPQKLSLFPITGALIGYSVLSPDKVVVRSKRGAQLLEKNEGSYTGRILRLPPGTSFVRSMVMAGDNLLMAVASRLGGGGMFLSPDMGRTWKRVCPEFKVSPVLPLAASGEILSVNPKNAQEIMAGSDRHGVFFSSDGGETWKNIGLKGEAIANVTYNPKVIGCVSVLTVDCEANTGRIFVSRDHGKKWDLRADVPGTGFLKIFYDGWSDGKIFIFSNKGLYTSFNMAHSLNRVLQVLPSDQPCLAADFKKQKWFAVPLDGSAVYKSSVNGLSWKKQADGDKGWGQVFDLRIDEKDGNHITLYVEKGIYESADEGKTWKKLLIH